MPEWFTTLRARAYAYNIKIIQVVQVGYNLGGFVRSKIVTS